MEKALSEKFKKKRINKITFKFILSRVSDSSMTKDLLLVSNLLDLKISSSNIMRRVITFSRESQIILEGISYWDYDLYRKVFGEEENEAIGKILIQKEIEYSRTIQRISYFKAPRENVIRFSNYKIEGKVAFILLEVLYTQHFQEIFGLFNK